MNEINPIFEAAYAEALAQPTTPNSEAMITMRPPPSSRMPGSADRTRKNVPERLTSTLRHQSSGSCSRKGVMLM